MCWPLQTFPSEYWASAGVACSAEVHPAKVRGAPWRGPTREGMCFTSAPDIFSVSMKQENSREASGKHRWRQSIEKNMCHTKTESATATSAKKTSKMKLNMQKRCRKFAAFCEDQLKHVVDTGAEVSPMACGGIQVRDTENARARS